MFKLFFILIFFYKKLTINEVFSKSITHENIVGGTNTTIEDHPWQVALFVKISKNNSMFICGGSILSPKYVLTAAHCLSDDEEYTIRAGSTYYDNGGNIRGGKPIPHPDSSQSMEHDLGLLELDKEFDLDGVTCKAVTLPNKDDILADKEELVVTGWGLHHESDYADTCVGSDQLQEVTVPVVNHKECMKIYDSDIQVHESEICAGYPEGGRDSCQGDSGGPAVIKKSKTIVGIVSRGRGCARPNFPGIYTNVMVHREWIREVTGV